MASLRLKFPEKDEPSVIVLTGARVTLGRLPLNTIQIIDRTLSGFHAEFVLEDDHYRLHDRGSTNGTFVNGESITDYHLRDACKVSFGALECTYNPEPVAPAESANVEALPTRSEINVVRQENAELKNRVSSLREELDALNKARSTEAGSNTVAVQKEEYDKLVAERESLKESQHALHQEITRLKTDLALLQRDRENLKKVAETAKAEFASFRAEPESAPAAATAPVEAEKHSASAAAEKAEPAAAEAPKEPAPAATEPPASAPAAKPAPPTGLPKPSLPLPIAAKAAPKPPGALPSAPAKFPAPSVPGARPVPATGVPTPVAKPVPAPGAVPVPKPVPTAGAVLKPVAVSGSPGGAKPPLKPIVRPAAPAAKGGTQKIEVEAVPIAKPVAPTVRAPMKPPVKLPLQPTVKLQAGSPPQPPPGKAPVPKPQESEEK